MTLKSFSLIEQAATLSTKKSELPGSSELVKSLLEVEKAAKKNKPDRTFLNLIGVWNLRFITGTKKNRKRAGIALGAERYIPSWLKIKIAYSCDREPKLNLGRVRNTVELGFLSFSLTGPVKFLESKNILAFDFTAISIEIFGNDLYSGYIRNGAAREAEFYNQKISQQAFFTYFAIENNVIAARGRGGGLALWGKLTN